MDRPTPDQHDVPDLRPGKACVVHVPEQATEPEAGCHQRFQKRISSCDHSCSDHLFADRTCELIDRNIDRWYQRYADVHRKSEYKTYFVNNWFGLVARID